MSGKKKKSHYLDNKRFQEVIFLYIEDNKAHEDELVHMLDTLINHIVKSFKFNVDYDDAKQECFVLCLKVVRNFTQEKGSAFNYFTTVILNHLRQMYTKNKKYNEKIATYRDMKGDVFSDSNNTPS